MDSIWDIIKIIVKQTGNISLGLERTCYNVLWLICLMPIVQTSIKPNFGSFHQDPSVYQNSSVSIHIIYSTFRLDMMPLPVDCVLQASNCRCACFAAIIHTIQVKVMVTCLKYAYIHADRNNITSNLKVGQSLASIFTN